MARNDDRGQRQARTKLELFNLLLQVTLLKPAVLLIRLVNDERKRTALSARVPESQAIKITPRRRLALIVGAGLVLLQIVTALLISLGVGTTGKGPEFFLERLYYNGIGRAGEWSDLVYPLWLYGFFLAPPLAWLTYIITFHQGFSGKSPHKKMMMALAQAGLDQPKGYRAPWFYEGRVLDIYLANQTPKALTDNEGLWKQAGFSPNPDSIELEDNRHLFLTAIQKSVNSTMIYDRYDEWTDFICNPNTNFKWWFGEYVNEDGYHIRDCFDGFSAAFIGTSGSGKTEAMKTWLTAFLAKHSTTRLIVCDLKEGGSWDAFAPVAEYGKVVKDKNDVLKAVAACYALLKHRQGHMKKHGYDDFRTWSEREGVDVPAILLVIDEFPQLTESLKYDMQSGREGTPANALFKLLTMGRAYGIWCAIGSQFGGSEYIPSSMNKNIKVHCVLRVGSQFESANWIETDDAFRIGKRIRLPSGGFDPELGHAYIDHRQEFVRFWYMHDWFIVHELMKYGVATMADSKYADIPTPKPSKKIVDKIKEHGEDALTRSEQNQVAKLREVISRFEQTYDEIKTRRTEFEGHKKPLLPDFLPDEDPKAYVTRLCEHFDVANPFEEASSGSPFGMRGGGMFFDETPDTFTRPHELRKEDSRDDDDTYLDEQDEPGDSEESDEPDFDIMADDYDDSAGADDDAGEGGDASSEDDDWSDFLESLEIKLQNLPPPTDSEGSQDLQDSQDPKDDKHS